jgi:hypothetical protein
MKEKPSRLACAPSQRVEVANAPTLWFTYSRFTPETWSPTAKILVPLLFRVEPAEAGPSYSEASESCPFAFIHRQAALLRRRAVAIPKDPAFPHHFVVRLEEPPFGFLFGQPN